MSDNTTNVTNNTYLDKEGLQKLIRIIKDTYASISSVNDLERALNEEITRSSQEDGKLGTALSAEIATREALDSRVSNLVRGVTVNGASVVNPETKIADINISHYTGASIQVYDDFQTLDSIDLVLRQNDKLYITRDNGKVYQWFDNSWREIGGQDENLREDFEEYKDLVDETYSLKSDVYSKVDTYNKNEVDDIIEHMVVPEGVIDSHINSQNPHPAMEARINASLSEIEETLTEKVDTSTLNSHILDRSNPHKVTKAQLELGNVDNTSDMSKPISLATQAALDNKVDVRDIINNLDTLVSSQPLSALQGARLKGLIQDARDEIHTIVGPLKFKGTVESFEEFEELTGMNQGDCWQIVESGEEETPHNGEMYAWTGSEWKKVLATVSDTSSYAAPLEDIYDIINRY